MNEHLKMALAANDPKARLDACVAYMAADTAAWMDRAAALRLMRGEGPLDLRPFRQAVSPTGKPFATFEDFIEAQEWDISVATARGLIADLNSWHEIANHWQTKRKKVGPPTFLPPSQKSLRPMTERLAATVGAAADDRVSVLNLLAKVLDMRVTSKEPWTRAWTERALARAERNYFRISDWSALSGQERAQELASTDLGSFNAQKSADIEWAQWSWNPIVGCLHDCPYCYARDIALVYPGTTKATHGFEPALYPGRLSHPSRTKVPEKASTDIGFRNVFVGSMTDLMGRWVPKEWIEAVIAVCKANPQWNFLMLTKFPKRYIEFVWPENCWLGTTVDCQARVASAEAAFAQVSGGVKWLSVEPMLEPLNFTKLDLFDWVVIGGASASQQTPSWHPPFDWVVDLHVKARAAGCRVYQKTNLFGPDMPQRLREYPGATGVEPVALPEALKYLNLKSKDAIELGEAISAP